MPPSLRAPLVLLAAVATAAMLWPVPAQARPGGQVRRDRGRRETAATKRG